MLAILSHTAVHHGGSNDHSAPGSDSGIQVTAVVWIRHLQVLHFTLSVHEERERRGKEGTLARNCLGLELNQVTSAYMPLARSQSIAPPD